MASVGETRRKEWPLSFIAPLTPPERMATWELKSVYIDFAETPPIVTEDWKCVVSAPPGEEGGPAVPGPAAPPGGGGPAGSDAPPGGGGGGAGPPPLPRRDVQPTTRRSSLRCRGPGPSAPLDGGGVLESGRQGGGPGPGPSAPLGGGGVLESGRQGVKRKRAEQVVAEIIRCLGHIPNDQVAQVRAFKAALVSLDCRCCGLVPANSSGSNQHQARVKCFRCGRLIYMWTPSSLCKSTVDAFAFTPSP